MQLLLKSLLATIALAAAVFAATAAAQEQVTGRAGERILLVQADGPSLRQAVEQVRRQYNGRIVSAETRVSGNREVHHIKVLTQDGKVKTVRIRGRSRGA